MKHERATEETRQQAALYTLGLLTQHEAHCFELHIKECAVCRAEFDNMLLAAAQIGLAVDEEEPPDDFRERLAARIDWSPQAELLLDFHGEKKSESASTVKPASRSGSRKTVVVINVIIVVFIALGWFYIRQTVEEEKLRLQSQIESSKDDLSDLRMQFDSQRENAEKLENFLNLFKRPSVREARLTGLPATPDNTGAVFWDDLTDEITVVGVFAPAPEGQIYRLWFTTSSGTTSVGLLPSDENGHIFTVAKLNKSVTAVSEGIGIMAIVTLEPESDSSERAEPESVPVAAGRVLD